MEQLEGFVAPGREYLVCKLLKSLCGLKQAPRVWYQFLCTFLEKLNFHRLIKNRCVFIGIIDGLTCYIAVYVDDLLIVAPMTSSADPSSETYITYPSSTPCERTLKLTADMHPSLQSDIHAMQAIPYREAVGCMMCLMVGTRPDFAYFMREVSQFLASPGQLHWHAVLRGLRYLQGTSEFGITLGGTSNVAPDNLADNLTAYSDSDYANCPDTRRSVGGYVTMLGDSPISWLSRKHHTVVLSTTGAEYVALCHCMQEMIFLKLLLKGLGFPTTTSLTIREDNQSCIKISNNPELHERSKHIDIRYHFVQEKVERHELVVTYCSTKQMIADIFTKALDKHQFRALREGLGVRTLSNPQVFKKDGKRFSLCACARDFPGTLGTEFTNAHKPVAQAQTLDRFLAAMASHVEVRVDQLEVDARTGADELPHEGAEHHPGDAGLEINAASSRAFAEQLHLGLRHAKVVAQQLQRATQRLDHAHAGRIRRQHSGPVLGGPARELRGGDSSPRSTCPRRPGTRGSLARPSAPGALTCAAACPGASTRAPCTPTGRRGPPGAPRCTSRAPDTTNRHCTVNRNARAPRAYQSACVPAEEAQRSTLSALGRAAHSMSLVRLTADVAHPNLPNALYAPRSHPPDAGAEAHGMRAAEIGAENMERETDALHQADVLQAMQWAEEAWQHVASSSIANCWRHAKILDEEMYELVDRVQVDTALWRSSRLLGRSFMINERAVASSVGLIQQQLHYERLEHGLQPAAERRVVAPAITNRLGCQAASHSSQRLSCWALSALRRSGFGLHYYSSESVA
ncbi:Integrase catalytic core protein, partial [Globisporangium splendens]